MNKKALALLSGGLDSILAIKLMLEQGIEVEAINFLTIFCTCTRKGCKHAATQAAETLKIPLKIFNITEEYLEIIKNPKHGYGSNMNPCIDCRIFIFTKAKDYMKEVGASFIVTGEVLGERPMSQRKDAILLIERKAGLSGLILRPLSAKLFEPTIPEKEGIVDRNRLLDISGRSRKPQIALAKEFGINDYPCPAGGCLLTDPGFAKRVEDLLEHDSLTMENLRLLKAGRHFRLSKEAKLIVGRDEADNKILQSLAGSNYIAFKLKDHQGPFSILMGARNDEMIHLAGRIIAHHTKFRNNDTLRIECWMGASQVNSSTISVTPYDPAELERLRI